MKFETIPVKKFLEDRERSIGQLPDGVIVCDPGDDIVCDICNADVVEDPVHVEGSWLWCPDCRKKEFK